MFLEFAELHEVKSSLIDLLPSVQEQAEGFQVSIYEETNKDYEGYFILGFCLKKGRKRHKIVIPFIQEDRGMVAAIEQTWTVTIGNHVQKNIETIGEAIQYVKEYQ